MNENEEIYISSQAKIEKGSIEDFENYISNVASVGANSAKKYIEIIKKFKGKGFKFTARDVNAFLKQDPRTVTKAALIHYAKSQRKFFLADEIKRMRYKKKPKKIHTIPSYEEIIKVIEQLDKENALIAEFLLCTGARCSEVMQIEYRDIEPDRKIKLRGKGGKERWCQLPDALYERLMDYFRNEKGVSGNMKVFYTDSSASLQNKVKMFWFKLHRAALHTIQKNIQTHDFRRFFAKAYYEKTGRDIILTQKILGHSDIRTTAIYTSFVEEKDILRPAAELSSELQLLQKKKETEPASG